jgi:hypothetical protein
MRGGLTHPDVPTARHELTYCGKDFSDADMTVIQRIIEEDPARTRLAISRMVCDALGWCKPDGGRKEMSCRVALLRMQEDGLVRLPPPRRGNGNQIRYTRRTPEAEPQPAICLPAGALPDLRLDPILKHESHLWNEYIDRYHYLGYQRLPGAQMRYFARAAGAILALLGFGAAAWKAAPRDAFIGWTPTQRAQRLSLVVNNARFLILPWVASTHLASTLLARAAKRLPDDWLKRYGYRPVLLETFVEKPRFRGTCYQAANWQWTGDTQGRGKLDRHRRYALPIKSIWLYPLSPRFRQILTQ